MYSPVIERAIQFAFRAHEGQERKGQPGVPYITHPVHVGILLARYGFADVICAAGVLHDVVEDCDVSLSELAGDFGAEVAGYVDEVSEDKSLPWAQRKRATIESVAGMSEGARAVTAADKLHNLSDIAVQEDVKANRCGRFSPRGKTPA